MRHVISSVILLSVAACATDPAQDNDLGVLIGGKADAPDINAPLRVDAHSEEVFTLSSDGPFTVALFQNPSPQPAIVRVNAVVDGDGTMSWTVDASAEPELEVHLPAGVPRDLVITVRNASATPFRGRLVLTPIAVAACDDTEYLAWMTAFHERINDAGSFIDANEELALRAHEELKPCESLSAYVYEAWLSWFDVAFSGVGAVVEPAEAVKLSFVSAAKPATATFEAYSPWFLAWIPRFQSAGQFIDEQERISLALHATARPSATDDVSYAMWLGFFDESSRGVGTTLDQTELARLNVLLAVKPCGVETQRSRDAMLEWGGRAPAAVLITFKDAARFATCQ